MASNVVCNPLQGLYGKVLSPSAMLALQAAQEWARHNVSENDPLDLFPADQLYVAFVVADGGCDLERFDIRHFDEARSLLLQVGPACPSCPQPCLPGHKSCLTVRRSKVLWSPVRAFVMCMMQAVVALAVAEAACQFEHRDLHWGNVLLRRGAPATTHARLRCTPWLGGMARISYACLLLHMAASPVSSSSP